MALASPAGQTGLDLHPPRHRAPAQQGTQRLFFFSVCFCQEKKKILQFFRTFFLLHFLALISSMLQVLPLYDMSMTFFSSQTEVEKCWRNNRKFSKNYLIFLEINSENFSSFILIYRFSSSLFSLSCKDLVAPKGM